MTCIKCGNDTTPPKWHVGSQGTSSIPGRNVCSPGEGAKSNEEHLHYICRCGWDWTGPLFDSKSES